MDDRKPAPSEDDISISQDECPKPLDECIIDNQSPAIGNDADDITPPSLREKYRFLNEIGHGAQGKIYRALRLSDETVVVIKQLNINSIKTWKEYELFHRESEVLKTLNIPGVARFFDAIECLEDDPPCSYIVQEYIEGASLQTMINASHRFKVDDVYDILIQTLHILYKLHNQVPPVIHRDIKPSNLMITTDEEGRLVVKVIDFGAVANPQIQGGGSTVAGTYGYMPPEQLTGKPVPQSDVYALAAVAVHLFTGKSPANMPTKDFRLIFEPEMQNYPHPLVTVLRKMLEPNVEERLADIPAIIQMFTDFRKEKYKYSGAKKDNTDHSDYDKKIEDLECFGEDGNIDLWQQLPEETPRFIARPYKMRLSGYSPILAEPYQESIFKNIYNYSNMKDAFVSNLFLAAMGPIIAISALATTYALGLDVQSHHIVTIAIVFAVVWILLSYLSYRIKIRKFTQGAPFVKQQRNDGGNLVDNVYEELMNLLQNGRKTIAVITDIEYLPLSSKELEVTKIAPNSGFPPNVSKIYTYYGYPGFKIHYKFNPPDDYREEDITHTFITHSEMSAHLKIGDPMPILYTIQDKYFFDLVTSIPYPVPVWDMNNLYHLVAQSRGESKAHSKNRAR